MGAGIDVIGLMNNSYPELKERNCIDFNKNGKIEVAIKNGRQEGECLCDFDYDGTIDEEDYYEFVGNNRSHIKIEIINTLVNDLLKALKDEKIGVSYAAAEALGRIKDPRAVESLIAALKNKESDVRRAAAEALGKIKDPRAVEGLIATLKDPKDDVCWAAAEALGKIKDPRAVEGLIIVLRNKNGYACWAAARALGQIKDPRVVNDLITTLKDKGGEIRWIAAWALGNIGVPAVGSLIATLKYDLKNQISEVRYLVAKALGKIGTPAVESLIATLRDKNSIVREGAVQALGKIKDPRAVKALTTVLKKDKDDMVRNVAAMALGEIEDPQAVESLIAALRDDDNQVRASAAMALGQIKDPRAVEGLIAALKDDDDNMVRGDAVWALGKIKDPRAVEGLIAALKDECVGVRQKSAITLGEIKDPRAIKELESVPKDDDMVRGFAEEALEKIKRNMVKSKNMDGVYLSPKDSTGVSSSQRSNFLPTKAGGEGNGVVAKEKKRFSLGFKGVYISPEVNYGVTKHIQEGGSQPVLYVGGTVGAWLSKKIQLGGFFNWGITSGSNYLDKAEYSQGHWKYWHEGNRHQMSMRWGIIPSYELFSSSTSTPSGKEVSLQSSAGVILGAEHVESSLKETDFAPVVEKKSFGALVGTQIDLGLGLGGDRKSVISSVLKVGLRYTHTIGKDFNKPDFSALFSGVFNFKWGN